MTPFLEQIFCFYFNELNAFKSVRLPLSLLQRNHDLPDQGRLNSPNSVSSAGRIAPGLLLAIFSAAPRTFCPTLSGVLSLLRFGSYTPFFGAYQVRTFTYFIYANNLLYFSLFTSN